MYEAYEGHHLSGGGEQMVFQNGAAPRPRTQAALERCRPLLPECGNLLDVGTGDGAVLKSAARAMPKWCLHAFDVAGTREREIMRLRNVESFSHGRPESLPRGPFDLIVMWHTLEHVPAPLATFRSLRPRLRAGGFLLVQVPDVWRTPFDLAVIDHRSHFTRQGLRELARRSGFEVVRDGRSWTHNCLTLLLRPAAAGRTGRGVRGERAAGGACFDWLNGAVMALRKQLAGGRYAIFGTGMAGLWLSTQMERPPELFIDEDARRTGRLAHGVPITLPRNVRSGIPVVLSFTRGTGRNIQNRLLETCSAARRWSFVLTPPGPFPGGRRAVRGSLARE